MPGRHRTARVQRDLAARLADRLVELEREVDGDCRLVERSVVTPVDAVWRQLMLAGLAGLVDELRAGELP